MPPFWLRINFVLLRLLLWGWTTITNKVYRIPTPSRALHDSFLPNQIFFACNGWKRIAIRCQPSPFGPSNTESILPPQRAWFPCLARFWSVTGEDWKIRVCKPALLVGEGDRVSGGGVVLATSPTMEWGSSHPPICRRALYRLFLQMQNSFACANLRRATKQRLHKNPRGQDETSSCPRFNFRFVIWLTVRVSP